MGDENSIVPIQSRIYFNGSFGTVKYCGPVHDKEGLWYGIDWDDFERGKHNGTFAGVNYFSTNHPTSGSFVLISKVDTGVSLAAAINERYVHCYETLTDEDRLLQQKSGDRLIEFVGAKKVAHKISQNQKLQIADVHLSRISYAGDVSSLVPNLTQLDLSSNLISDWSTVVDILNQLPFLSNLDLSGNRMKRLQSSLPCFPQLTNIVLNRMQLVWNDITALANFLSNVQNLTVVSNRITELDTSLAVFQNLTELDLSQNQIASWEEVLKLGHLPKLASLNLMENSVDRIRIPEKSILFPSLQSLNLSGNDVGSWTDVAELGKLEKLERLLLARNPVQKLETVQNARQLIIAKIGTLKYLEGIEITRQERQGAEWDYITKFWLYWQKMKDDSNFIAEHPRYTSLIKIHGNPDLGEKSDFSVEKIPLLSVNIYSPLLLDKDPIVRKIPANIVVGRLKQMIKKWLHINENNLILSYKAAQHKDGVEYSINDDIQFLSFYSVTSGDLLCVRW